MEMEARIERTLAFLGDLSPLEIRFIETVGLILFIALLRSLLLLIVRGQTEDARLRYHWRKGITYTLGIIGLVTVARIWIVGLGSIWTFVGLVGAGVVISLKEPLSNFAAWVFLIWRRPFTVGDRVQIGDYAGDVIDLGMLEFSLLEIGNWVHGDQSTGRIIHVPNGRVFVDPVANYTRDFPYLWNEIEVLVTFESNWTAAKDILLGVAQRQGRSLSEDAEQAVLAASKRFMIFYSTLSPTVYTKVTQSGVSLTIRYLCEARQRRDTEQNIWESVLREIGARDDIDFAYPTRRFFSRREEERTLRGAAPSPDSGLE